MISNWHQKNTSINKNEPGNGVTNHHEAALRVIRMPDIGTVAKEERQGPWTS